MIDFVEYVAGLHQRWAELHSQYVTLRDRIMPQVVRWEWASDERYNLRPLYFERFGIERGQVLEAKPPDETQPVQYGFDAAGRVMVTHYHEPGAVLREYYTYTAGLVESVQFADATLKYVPIQISQYRYQDEQISRYDGIEIHMLDAHTLAPSIGGFFQTNDTGVNLIDEGSSYRSHEIYRYDANRLTLVLHRERQYAHHPAFDHVQALRYGEGGTLSGVDIVERGHTHEGFTTIDLDAINERVHTDHMAAWQPLENRWREAFTLYEQLQQAARTATVRTEWADDERYNLRPLYFRRNLPRGKMLNAKPEDYHMEPLEYGFDAADRVVWVMQYSPFGDPDETFYIHGQEFVEAITFQSRIPYKVERFYFDDNRFVHYIRLSKRYGANLITDSVLNANDLIRSSPAYDPTRCEREMYVYEAGRLVKITTQSATPTQMAPETQEIISYDDSGELACIELKTATHSRLIYRKRKAGQTLASITQAAQSKLIAHIPQLVAAQGFEEPLYCIHLYYHDEYFPPTIWPGVQSYQERIINGDVAVDLWEVWLPGTSGPRSDLVLTDEATLEACAELEQEISQDGLWEHGRRSLREVAKALTEMDWSGIAETTDDFIVYAIDFEGDDLEETLLACGASEAQIKKWKQQGLMWE